MDGQMSYWYIMYRLHVYDLESILFTFCSSFYIITYIQNISYNVNLPERWRCWHRDARAAF